MPDRWFPNFGAPMEMMLTMLAIGSLIAAVIVPKLITRSAKKTTTGEPFKVDVYFPAFIVRIVLIESICLNGFALGKTAGVPRLIIPFIVVSVFMMMKNYPSTEQKLSFDLSA
jgi:hypothetical protein